MITILGPTACGKTSLAAYVADRLNGEVISADSRQVYRGLDIGTGKDLAEYVINGRQVPYHLIDILDPGQEYNVFLFQQDFFNAYYDITSRGRLPVLCGGTGLYIESVLEGYNLVNVPINSKRREELAQKSMDELIDYLSSFGPLHATTDITNLNRLIKAIEQKEYFRDQGLDALSDNKVQSLIIGLAPDRKLVRNRITARLQYRLDHGLIEEVQLLLSKGTDPKRLLALGLEYKWLTLYVSGQIDRTTMTTRLNTAIHQFAKRQMTWFRRMERKGFQIHWFTKGESNEEMFNKIEKMLNKSQSDLLY